MRRFRFDGLLMASALAIIFTATSGLPAGAGIADNKSVTAAVPLPEPANVPPPTAADVGAPAATSIATTDIDSRVPLPESANVPPPSLDDVGGPATATSSDTKAPDTGATPA